MGRCGGSGGGGGDGDGDGGGGGGGGDGDSWRCRICGGMAAGSRDTGVKRSFSVKTEAELMGDQSVPPFVSQTSCRTVVCEGGHVWPRCVKTLLPCDTPVLLRCGWCKSAALQGDLTNCDICLGPL